MRVALHATQAIAEIAGGWVRKDQQEITGKRAREGKKGEEYGSQNTEVRIQNQELGSVKA